MAVAHTKKFVAAVKKLQTDGRKGQWADKEKALMTRFIIPGEPVAIASSRGKRWACVGPPHMLFFQRLY